MINPLIIQSILSNILNAKNLNNLKLLKNQLSEDVFNRNDYNYTDVLLLSLAIEFRTYVLLNEEEKNPEFLELKELYKNDIIKINKKSLFKIKKLFDKFKKK